MSAFGIREAKACDIAEIAALEAACFSFPWSASDFETMIAAPERTLLVAEEAGGGFLGYIGAYTVAGETDISTVAVLPAARGRGVGYALVSALTAKMPGDVFLEVRKSNAAARALYEKCGFTPCGERKNYYAAPREDAVLYRFSPAGGK